MCTEIEINKKFLEQIIIILHECYYVSIEIDNNYLIISNYSDKEYSKIINPFPEANINKDKIQNILIYILPNYINKVILERQKRFHKKINNEKEFMSLLRFKDIYIDFLNNTPSNLIILYLPDFISLIYCNNINNYIMQESNLRENILEERKCHKIYYRGNKLNFDLSTSLYRDNMNPEFEHILNNRCIQSMPKDFDGCETFFDKLTILKHFNCPSRLLDITKNSLVAAFFALDNYESSNSAKYGAVNLCFPQDVKIIKNSHNSDSVALISALSTTDKKLPSYKIIKDIIILLDQIYINLIDDKVPVKSLFEKNLLFRPIDDLKEAIKITLSLIDRKLISKTYTLLNNFLKKIIILENCKDNRQLAKLSKNFLLEIEELRKQLVNDQLLQNLFFEGELQHQASLINSTFNSYLPRYEDINSYYIVHPSLNNGRIRNQQGLFVLIGAIFDENDYFLKGNKEYLKLFEYDKKRVVLIINNRGNKFYEELNQVYGINKGFIYPELEKKINQIKSDIKYEYDIK